MTQEKFNVDDVFNKLKEKILLSSDDSHEPYIPDIMEFCNSKKYLNLPGMNVNLYPMQRIILQTFYRGQRGNEHVKLTEDELKLLRKNKLMTVIEKYHSDELFRDLVLVLGRRCVSEDTSIFDPATGKEWRLGAMWDYGKTENIMSWTMDERTNDMKVVPNCNLLYQGKRTVYRLTTSTGHSIEATDNHPFMTQRGWVQLKDLNIESDRVALVESEPFFGNSDAISEDEAAILGYMTGDGNCSQSSTFFTCSQKEVLEDFKERINRISDNLIVFNDPWTGAKSKKYQYKITCKDRLQESYFNEQTQKVMSKLSKTDLQRLLIKHGIMGKTCHHKIVPNKLFECPQNVIAAYLRALYSCDGGIYIKDKCAKIEFYTVNKGQASSIQKLLSKFGIFSSVYNKKTSSKIKQENGKIRKYNCTSYKIEFSKQRYVEIFLNCIGFIGKDEQINSVKSLYRKRNVEHRDTKVIFGRISEITLVGKKRTFDLQVSDKDYEQNFAANGFLVHNSGKDFMVSLIALYEAMKLLEIPGGCPYKYYNLSPGNPIYILTVATSSDQAKILFTEIKAKMNNCQYFRNKIGYTDADRIWLLTPEDKKRNKELAEQGLEQAQTKGTVVIMSGHSNSDSLLGKGYYCLLFDEVASFKSTGSASSGERLYSALGPGTAAFNKPVWIENGKQTISPKNKKTAIALLDENGDQVKQLDSKIISISSPRAEEGIFFKLYNDAPSTRSRLAFRLPTWKVNEGITEGMLRAENKYMSANEFMMEFGAEFSGTAGEKFIADRYINEAFQIGQQIGTEQRLAGRPGMIYYAHLDPAATSHNYALTVMHIEQRIQVKEKENGTRVKEQIKLFVVDHLKVWHPSPNKAINVYEVDNYIIDLAKRFRFGMVSYDSWNSLASIQKLRSKGIPTKMTPFRKQYKMQIYNQLEYLLVNHQIALPYRGPHSEQLDRELKCLKRIYTPTGFKIEADPEGAVTTDDMTDSLAGVIGVAMESTYSGYVKSGTVNMPQFRGSNQRWNVGSGQYSTQEWNEYNRKFGMP